MLKMKKSKAYPKQIFHVLNVYGGIGFEGICEKSSPRNIKKIITRIKLS